MSPLSILGERWSTNRCPRQWSDKCRCLVVCFTYIYIYFVAIVLGAYSDRKVLTSSHQVICLKWSKTYIFLGFYISKSKCSAACLLPIVVEYRGFQFAVFDYFWRLMVFWCPVVIRVFHWRHWVVTYILDSHCQIWISETTICPFVEEPESGDL